MNGRGSPFSSEGLNMVATCALGLEPVLEMELGLLEVGDMSQSRGAVEFSGDLRTLYNANLRLRTAIRIFLPVIDGFVNDRTSLYNLARQVPWERYFTRRQTFVVDTVGSAPGIKNTAFAALVVKDAIVDRLRAEWGERPSVDRAHPDLKIHLRLSRRQTTISIDSSGEPLSHRGYRVKRGVAPLNEALASGILFLAGYDGSTALVDPFCGTGTLVAEAAQIATRTAPGLKREFAFEKWHWHDQNLLDRLRFRARQRKRTAPAPIHGADADGRAVRSAQRQLELAGVSEFCTIRQAEFKDLELPEPGSMIIGNPPWGRRMGEGEDLTELYREIGDTLKNRAQGSTAWLLVGDRQLMHAIGLKASRRIPVFNGAVECRLLRYDLYAGSKKHKD